MISQSNHYVGHLSYCNIIILLHLCVWRYAKLLYLRIIQNKAHYTFFKLLLSCMDFLSHNDSPLHLIHVINFHCGSKIWSDIYDGISLDDWWFRSDCHSWLKGTKHTFSTYSFKKDCAIKFGPPQTTTASSIKIIELYFIVRLLFLFVIDIIAVLKVHKINFHENTKILVYRSTEIFTSHKKPIPIILFFFFHIPQSSFYLYTEPNRYVFEPLH